ncbi:hypothetical protein EJB05_29423 [Eragrostis curvula]|uniref:Uncharacterized protein n=1 Tax=Eragrostis curvula TaxID=38414 RepID=A0A5J9UTY1_9POAL|nr:hypothetical protein EJB05_29423 [Eragrostis curvula]
MSASAAPEEPAGRGGRGGPSSRGRSVLDPGGRHVGGRYNFPPETPPGLMMEFAAGRRSSSPRAACGAASSAPAFPCASLDLAVPVACRGAAPAAWRRAAPDCGGSVPSYPVFGYKAPVEAGENWAATIPSYITELKALERNLRMLMEVKSKTVKDKLAEDTVKNLEEKVKSLEDRIADHEELMADLRNPEDNKLIAEKIKSLEDKLMEDKVKPADHSLIEGTIKTLEDKVKVLEDRIMEDEAKFKILEEKLLKNTLEDRPETPKSMESRLGIPRFRLKEDSDKLKGKGKVLEDKLRTPNVLLKKNEDKLQTETHKGKLKAPDKLDTLTEKLKRLKHHQPDDKEKARHFALFMAVLLIMIIPVLVLRSLGQPLLAVWRLSFLLCGCAFFLIRFLDVTMRAQTSLFCNCAGFMLALYADAALDPKIGMLAAHLNVHVSLVLLGYALAERRQLDGTEVSAWSVPTLSEEKQEGMLDLQILGGIFVGILTFLGAAYIVWVVCNASNRSIVHLMISVFIPLSSLVMFWSIFAGCMLLHGALVGETGFLSLVIYFLSCIFLMPLSSLFVGDIGGLLLTLLATLGLPGFFGYSVSIYACSKQWLKLQLQPAQESSQMLEQQARVKLD